jgi:hypothetical protein
MISGRHDEIEVLCFVENIVQVARKVRKCKLWEEFYAKPDAVTIPRNENSFIVEVVEKTASNACMSQRCSTIHYLRTVVRVYQS